MRRRVLFTAAAAAPLLMVPATSTARTSPLAALRTLERDYPGRIGVSAVHTGTGRALGYRAHERFPLLSTFKVLAAAAIQRKAREVEPGLLDRVVRYTEADLVVNSPVTGLPENLANGMTYAAICDAAITRSDNTAGNLLLRGLDGPPSIGRFARTLGDFRTRLDRWEPELNTAIPGDPRDTTTPAAMTANLRRLLLGCALHRADRAQLTGWMLANQTGAKRIRAGVPADWTVADKTGTGDYGTMNDVGMVVPPAGAPIVLSIYTSRTEPDVDGEDRVLADAARIVADAFTG